MFDSVWMNEWKKYQKGFVICVAKRKSKKKKSIDRIIITSGQTQKKFFYVPFSPHNISHYAQKWKKTFFSFTGDDDIQNLIRRRIPIHIIFSCCYCIQLPMMIPFFISWFSLVQFILMQFSIGIGLDWIDDCFFFRFTFVVVVVVVIIKMIEWIVFGW